MTDPSHQFDVIIIGYGPVGATAALLLRQRGLSVAVIDRLTEPFPLPRAAILDGEVARLLQNLGIKDAMGE
ncbi:MAG: FAD-dependent oxidoreductase, partial [Novosphingobium sp.]